MTEPNQSANNQNFDNQPESGNHSGESANQQLENTNNENGNRHRANRHPPTFKKVRRWIKRENNKSGIANIIAFIALLIGAYLSYYTYQVFNLSQTQAQSVIDAGNAAKRSADIAQETLDSSISYQKQLATSQKISDKKSDKLDSIKNIHDNAIFNLQKKGVDKQIAYIQETQKEFEIENRPFITLANAIIDTPSIGQRLNYSAMIINSGKQPASIIDAYYDLIPRIDSNYNDFDGIEHGVAIKNSVIAGGGYTIPIHSFTKNILTKDEIDYQKINPVYIYIRAIIIYRSFTGKKIYKTKIIYRINVDINHNSKTITFQAN
jgi:hypothetical protein